MTLQVVSSWALVLAALIGAACTAPALADYICRYEEGEGDE